MNHTVDACPLKIFEGGLNLLREADDDAVIWLESAATAALANNKEIICDSLHLSSSATVSVVVYRVGPDGSADL